MQAAIAGRRQVDEAGNTRRELREGAIARRDRSNPSAAVIADEVRAPILARKLRPLQVMKRPAADGAARAVIVGVERRRHALRCRRTLAVGPAVVRAALSFVDFFPCLLTDVVDEHPARHRLECECVRIS